MIDRDAATPRKVCVITGSRADYGLNYWLLKAVAAADGLDLRLVVTGAHLHPRFGETWKAIEADGFRIDAKVPMPLDDDTPLNSVRALAEATLGMARAFDELGPDVVVVLGDRYEMLAAGQAAMMLQVPIAHLHGGESTEGVIDEAIRHALTKMSHLHFVASRAYRKRVIQLGERPDRVFDVGALAVDGVRRMTFPDAAELAAKLGFPPDQPYLLATYHPLTLDQEASLLGVGALLAALDRFPALRVVLTGVNADPGHTAIDRTFHAYAAANPGRVTLFDSMGSRFYLAALRRCAAVVGNSSSGIIEAPLFRVPTVNIGDRQRGRERARSVIDCAADADAVAAAIERAVAPAFRQAIADMDYPFGSGRAVDSIVETLAAADLSGILMKRFHDIDFDPEPAARPAGAA